MADYNWEGYLAKTRQVESSGNPNAYRKGSGATGLYQITPRALEEYNRVNKTNYVMKDLYNPEFNTRVALSIGKTNAKELAKKGLPVDDFNLYMAHQQGLSGYSQLLEHLHKGKPLSPERLRALGDNLPKEYVAKYGASPQAFMNFWKQQYGQKLNPATSTAISAANMALALPATGIQQTSDVPQPQPGYIQQQPVEALDLGYKPKVQMNPVNFNVDLGQALALSSSQPQKFDWKIRG